jgi:hypothetical protein
MKKFEISHKPRANLMYQEVECADGFKAKAISYIDREGYNKILNIIIERFIYLYINLADETNLLIHE